MTFASIAASYEGVVAQINASNSVTISLADFAVNYVPIYTTKKENGLNAIQYDVQQYLMASLNYQDPAAPALAAKWNEQKSIDTSMMDTGSSSIENLIENAKSEASANETDMQNAIAAQEPISEYLKALLSLIASGLT